LNHNIIIVYFTPIMWETAEKHRSAVKAAAETEIAAMKDEGDDSEGDVCIDGCPAHE